MNEFPIYLLVLLIFVNRYLLGLHFKKLRGDAFDRPVSDYQPTVTIVTPLFNEGRGIYDTIRSLLEQDYPAEKLHVMVGEDCSTDDSCAWALKARDENPDRVTVMRNRVNMGKRRTINEMVRNTESEIIVSVDSDVVVDRQAVRRLVARFTRPDIAAVGGRVFVSNPHENWLTRMQAIKYWIGYEYLKNLERVFLSVMCLSGCLTAYRRSVLVELEPILENRNLLGVPITYGEDRFLTRQIVKAGYRTFSTLDAFCYTVAPNTLSKYFSQQLRWRRSNIVDFFGGITHAWKLHPLVGTHYLSLGAVLIGYPMVVAYKIFNESFWDLAVFHVVVLAATAAFYAVGSRNMTREYRVHPLWFLAMAVVMPVTYVLITPLAFFTLDSSSWETRSHPGIAPEPSEEPMPPLDVAEPLSGV
jgi:cellulose synthase/poly-beta-1,6-N-acetylglucosamine synthase-like glycosyltransferase